jgi:hypothetical protein
LPCSPLLQKYHCCAVHFKAPEVWLEGQATRFCQKVSGRWRMHPARAIAAAQAARSRLSLALLAAGGLVD